MRYLNTSDAPQAIGPYSQAVEANGLLFVSGQLGIDPRSGKMEAGIESQTKRSLSNVFAIVKAAGYSEKNIVKVTVYLKNMDDFPKFNSVYESFFGEHKPARATVEVARLPKDALVEIEAICIK